MGIIEKSKYIHWNYFLAMDSDTEQLSRYIEFTEENYTSYSIEMTRLLFAASSEIDVIAKLLCKRIDTNTKARSIDKYREILNPHFSKIKDIKVVIARYGLTLTPWDNWKQDENPVWWKAYNKVKHERDQHFSKANLKNTLNSIAALFILLLYYYQEERKNGKLAPPPKLFDLTDIPLTSAFSVRGGAVNDYVL